MTDLYKGHKNLAEMIRGHLGNLRAGLTALREVSKVRDDANDASYWGHEIKALGEIEVAVHAELATPAPFSVADPFEELHERTAAYAAHAATLDYTKLETRAMHHMLGGEYARLCVPSIRWTDRYDKEAPRSYFATDLYAPVAQMLKGRTPAEVSATQASGIFVAQDGTVRAETKLRGVSWRGKVPVDKNLALLSWAGKGPHTVEQVRQKCEELTAEKVASVPDDAADLKSWKDYGQAIYAFAIEQGEALEAEEAANAQWIEKTEWVQAEGLGKTGQHRADVLRDLVTDLRKQLDVATRVGFDEHLLRSRPITVDSQLAYLLTCMTPGTEMQTNTHHFRKV